MSLIVSHVLDCFIVTRCVGIVSIEDIDDGEAFDNEEPQVMMFAQGRMNVVCKDFQDIPKEDDDDNVEHGYLMLTMIKAIISLNVGASKRFPLRSDALILHLSSSFILVWRYILSNRISFSSSLMHPIRKY